MGEDGADPSPGPDHRDPARVRRVYDRIAGHFSGTRQHPWPEVTDFLEDAPRGRVGLDLGCGNGRHAGPLADRVDRVLALDASREVLRIARERLAGAEGPGGAGGTGARTAFLQGDAGRIPVRSGTVDVAVYVATLHHLPTRAARVGSLSDLARVLAPGGRALVGVWSTTHDRFDRTEGFDTTVDWTLPDGTVVDRFYHVYDPDEFRADLADSDLSVLGTQVSSGNCYARVGPTGRG